MKGGIFVIMTALVALIPFQSSAVDADVLVRNQRFSQDTFFFDVYLQASTSTNLFLCNSDFVLNFTEAIFTNPEFHYQSGSTDLVNCYGNSVSTFYDSNIGNRVEYTGLNAYKLMIYVQMPVYSNYTQFLDRLARIDQQALTHKLGTFYVTNATTLNTNPELSWVTSGKGLVLLVNHRDSATMDKISANIVAVNPAIETEPNVQASDLTITATSSTSLSLSWTRGNGDGSILFIREDSAISTYPADGLQYLADSVFGQGDQIGSTGAYTIYQGTDTSITVTGLTANTTYHFALFEYEGANGWSENYNQTNPDTLSQTTNGLFITANIKVFLQGPYNGSTGTMNTALRMGNSHGSTNLLPSAQPYSGSPWNYSGSENVDTANHPADAVDWVLVELRETYNGSPVTGGQAAGFLLSDGSIVDTNGVDQIRFWNVDPGYYYVVIKHRNHLAVMTADSILLNVNSSAYDFTTGLAQAYGSGQKSIGGGKFGLFAGDANADNSVKYNGSSSDRVAVLINVGFANPNNIVSNSYLKTDINLDRQVKYNGSSADRVTILITVGFANPNNIIISTLP